VIIVYDRKQTGLNYNPIIAGAVDACGRKILDGLVSPVAEVLAPVYISSAFRRKCNSMEIRNATGQVEPTLNRGNRPPCGNTGCWFHLKENP